MNLVGQSLWKPSIAADGTIYFVAIDTRGGKRLYSSRSLNGAYQQAQPLSFSDGTTLDVDPEIAPDGSFLIFCSAYLQAHLHGGTIALRVLEWLVLAASLSFVALALLLTPAPPGPYSFHFTMRAIAKGARVVCLCVERLGDAVPRPQNAADPYSVGDSRSALHNRPHRAWIGP